MLAMRVIPRYERVEPADLLIREDARISTVHCGIEWHEKGCHLRDLNSRLGTLVNATRVREVPLKAGDQILIGKTTTSVYLSAVAAGTRRDTTLIDADPQASAADWLESSEDEALERVTLIEAPTDRMLLKALDRIDGDEVAVVDTPPGNERLLAKAIEQASIVIIPTRVGGVETPRVEAVLDMVPTKVPVGLAICSARTYTRDYHDMVAADFGSAF